MESRIPGLSADVKVGQSVQDAIATAMPHLPK
jgi:hypothetical protein